jgi:hypothetical protein
MILLVELLKGVSSSEVSEGRSIQAITSVSGRDRDMGAISRKFGEVEVTGEDRVDCRGVSN